MVVLASLPAVSSCLSDRHVSLERCPHVPEPKYVWGGEVETRPRKGWKEIGEGKTCADCRTVELCCSLSLSFSRSLSLTHSLSVRDHGRYAYSGYIWGWGDLEAVFPSQSLVLLHKDEEQSGVTCKCTYCACKGHTHTHTIQTKTGVQIIM